MQSLNLRVPTHGKLINRQKCYEEYVSDHKLWLHTNEGGKQTGIIL